MNRVLRMVHAYRTAESLEFRLRLADSIVDETTPDLRMFIVGRCHASMVEDVLQETLLSIIGGLPECRAGSVGEMWSLWYSIARRRIADAFRDQNRNPAECMDFERLRELVESGTGERPLSDTDREDMDEALRILSSIDPLARDILWEHAFIGRTYEEIGVIHGMTAAAVRMRINRSLRQFRELTAKGQ